MNSSRGAFGMLDPAFVPVAHPLHTHMTSVLSTSHPYHSPAFTVGNHEAERDHPTFDHVPFSLLELSHNSSKAPGDSRAGGTSGRIIVWFRSDLRLEDNPALAHAVEEAGEVIPLYCFDPRHFGPAPFGFENTGRIRAKFLIEAVADVRESLERRGSGLLVRFGKPEDVIRSICRITNCKRVFCLREVTYDAQAVEKIVEEGLKKENVALKLFWSNSLYYPEDMSIALEDVPDCYSEFEEIMKNDENTLRSPLPAPKQIPAVPQIEHGKIPELSDLDVRAADSIMWQMAGNILGGESEAKKVLRKYLKKLGKAPAEKRACLYLALDFIDRVSPWLALGCLSPRNIYAAVKDSKVVKGKKSGTLDELIGQDFYRYIIYKHARARFEKLQNRDSKRNRS